MDSDYERIMNAGAKYVKQHVLPNVSGTNVNRQLITAQHFIDTCPEFPEAFLAYTFSGHVILMWILNSQLHSHAIIAVNDTKIPYVQYHNTIDGYEHVADNFMNYVREVPLNTTV